MSQSGETHAFLNGNDEQKEKIPLETDSNQSKTPCCIIILGMAGSGKTTFVKRIVSELFKKKKPYVINLDPACMEVPYPVNIGKYTGFCLTCKNILYYWELKLLSEFFVSWIISVPWWNLPVCNLLQISWILE